MTFFSESFTDSLTQQTMLSVFDQTNYVLDPHSAVGFLGLKSYLSKLENNNIGIFLETAHPSKFINIVEEVIRKHIDIPDRLAELKEKEKVAFKMANQFDLFKEYLLS